MGTEEAVRQVLARLEALQAHQQTPLSLALRCSGVGGDPLFNALLNYRHNQSNETLFEIQDADQLGAGSETIIQSPCRLKMTARPWGSRYGTWPRWSRRG